MRNNVGFYIDKYENLLPSDESVPTLVEQDWYIYLKGMFNDIVWNDFYNREIFLFPRFQNEDDEQNYNNIVKTIKIRLLEKARVYERMFNAFMSDYNPLWNVDGVVGTIHETNGTNTGTDTDVKSGKDTTLTEDNGTIRKSGSEQIAEGGTDTITGANTTFDSSDFQNTNKSTSAYGRTDTHTYNNVTDTHDLDGKNEITYNSQNQKTLNLANYQKDLDLVIRQGNIGVTKSSELLLDTLALYDDSLMQFAHLVVNDCMAQISYAIY